MTIKARKLKNYNNNIRIDYSVRPTKRHPTRVRNIMPQNVESAYRQGLVERKFAGFRTTVGVPSKQPKYSTQEQLFAQMTPERVAYRDVAQDLTQYQQKLPKIQDKEKAMRRAEEKQILAETKKAMKKHRIENMKVAREKWKGAKTVDTAVQKKIKQVKEFQDKYNYHYNVDKERIKSTFKSRDDAKSIKKRERAVRGTLTALGIIQGKQTYSGPGRPRGIYKYGVPIQVYKAQLRQKKAMYEQYQQDQAAKLAPQGFTPEQIQQLQQQQTMQELEQPSMSRVQRIQERVAQMQQPIVPMRYQKMKVPGGSGMKYVQPGRSVADEELQFLKWRAERTIHPNTQRVLDTIRRIQNKGMSDNIEQQRRIRERNMVGRSMNMMKAHENMIDTSVDFTGVPEDNILFAPSVFKEDPNNNILRKRSSFSLLSTREAGNDLKFF